MIYKIAEKENPIKWVCNHHSKLTINWNKKMENISEYSDTPKYRILIVEDHKIFRASLRALISEEPAFEIIGEAGDGTPLKSYEEVKPP
jgi:hypothetical protein